MIGPLQSSFESHELPLAPPTETEVIQSVHAMSEDLWRSTPATLAYKVTEGRWRPAKHLLHISAEVASCISNSLDRGEPGSLIVTVPPRHGKSELISVHTPMWVLDNWPNARIMLVGYGADLSEGFSRRVRDNSEDDNLVGSLRYHVRKDVRRVGEWQTDEGGVVYAIGVNGAITGRGANVLIVDDYIKNALEALSPATNQSIYDWFVSTVLTRLEPNACVIIVATRWGKDDLIGRLIADAARPWRVVRLPAIAEANDPIGRTIGAALWPDRYNETTMAMIKASLRKYWWSALYQQKPTDQASTKYRDGSIPRVQIIKNRDYLVCGRGWDLAATPKPTDESHAKVKRKKEPDFTVGFKWGYDLVTGMMYMLDDNWIQESAGKMELLLKATAEMDGYGCMIFFEEEPGSAGINYIHHLRVDVLPGYPIYSEKATGPKLFRANAMLSAIETGQVRMLEAPWNDHFEEELSEFPSEREGVKDDQIDAAAIGYNGLRARLKKRGVTWGRPVNPANVAAVMQQLQSKLVQGATWGRD